MSEAARLLQGALVGSRDSALKNGAPAGIRLLPDPAFPTGIDHTAASRSTLRCPLAYNRIIPIETAPEYSDGLVTVIHAASGHGTAAYISSTACRSRSRRLQAETTGGYPVPGHLRANRPRHARRHRPDGRGSRRDHTRQAAVTPNVPTSWFWNIRVGDKIQINNAGPWYTVIGPMAIDSGDGQRPRCS